MSNSQIEIIGTRERRRRWNVEEKLRIVAETHEPGASVRAVAARHDVYPNLLRTWRRLVGQGRLTAAPPASFVPVHVLESASVPLRYRQRLSIGPPRTRSRSLCPMAAGCVSAMMSIWPLYVVS